MKKEIFIGIVLAIVAGAITFIITRSNNEHAATLTRQNIQYASKQEIFDQIVREYGDLNRAWDQTKKDINYWYRLDQYRRRLEIVNAPKVAQKLWSFYKKAKPTDFKSKREYKEKYYEKMKEIVNAIKEVNESSMRE